MTQIITNDYGQQYQTSGKLKTAGAIIGASKMVLSSKKPLAIYLDEHIIDETSKKVLDNLRANDNEISFIINVSNNYNYEIEKNK